MAVTAKMVSELREKTGAAMMSCKKALEATDGDMEAALDHLRKQGLKAAAKKASRETAEGRVFAVLGEDGRLGHLVGVACETDFLSGSEQFLAFVKELRGAVERTDPTGVEDGARPFLSQTMENDGTVADALQAAVGQFGENTRISGLVRMENADGLVAAYVHHDNKQGVIVSVTTQADAAAANETLTSLCQHALVFMPDYATREQVAPDALERERQVIAESDEVKSKPEEIRGKIVEGKLRRFYAERVLEEQPWIHDDKTTVAKHLEKTLGAGTRIQAFARVALG